MSRPEAKHTHFPMFIDARGKHVLVIGGGSVAERRIRSLLEFPFVITVLSDQLTEELQRLAEQGRIRFIRGRWPEGAEAIREEAAEAIREAGSEAAADGPADILLACTNDRAVNRQIGGYGKREGIPVNVCDAQEESTFWFPAIALNEELTMGLTGNGKSHGTVRRAAAALRQVITEREYEK